MARFMDEMTLRFTPGYRELLEAEQVGSTVSVRTAGDVDLDEEDRRWLIKWLAARTPGLHVIECEHAGSDRG